MTINGRWGTGKTVFLKMWNQHLANEDFTTIYFSAWEDDYCDNALIALIGQIWKNLKESDFKEIVNSIKECAVPALKNTMFEATKKITGVNLELRESELKSVSEKAVDEYIVAGRILNDLKKRLGKLAAEVSQKEGKPLVIIIDELDRCRPLFAIELLEKVKHLFQIPGIVFVLGIDREQLGHSIKSVYGQDMNVAGYLRRFVDMEFILPQANSRVFSSHILNQFGIEKFITNGHDKYEFGGIFSALCDCFNLSLRDIEHCSRLLIVALTNMNLKKFHPLLVMLVVLKLVNTKLYNHYVSKNYNSEDVVKYILEQPLGKSFLNDDYGLKVEAYLYAASKDSWVKVFKKGTIIPPELLPKRINEIPQSRFDRLSEIYFDAKQRNQVNDHVLGYLSEKIELAPLMLDYRK